MPLVLLTKLRSVLDYQRPSHAPPAIELKFAPDGE